VVFRECAFCHEIEVDPGLVHYSVRRYAHPMCLLEKKGWGFILRLPECPLRKCARLLARRALTMITARDARRGAQRRLIRTMRDLGFV
jgi:hypothetical protein